MTEYGGSTRLPRYDWNTLQPIRNRHPLLNTDDGVILSGYRSYSRRPIPLDLYTVPRVSQQWPRPLSPLAAELPMASAPVQDLNGTVRTLKTPYIQVIPENELAVVPVSSPPPVVVNDGVQTTRVNAKFSWEERLFENYHVGIHRLVFLLRRFPALAALLSSIWILFGRKQTAGFDLSQYEVNQNWSVFVSMAVALLGIIFGVRNHGNQHKSALNQIVSRLGSLSLSLAGEITTFVLGLIAIINLAKLEESDPPSCYPQSCFSLNNRIVQSGIQLGLVLLHFILTVVAIFHGVRAIIRIIYDRKIARRASRQNRELASYSNPLVGSKPDIYY